jgi:hypothetical protein
MGRPLAQLVLALDGEPLAVNSVVTARVTVEACGLVENRPYRITGYEERALVPGRGNPKRFFYAIDGAPLCLVTLEMIRPGGPVCAHPFPTA